MMLSNMVRVRVRVKVISQSNKITGNKSGVYAVLGVEAALVRVLTLTRQRQDVLTRTFYIALTFRRV